VGGASNRFPHPPIFPFYIPRLCVENTDVPPSATDQPAPKPSWLQAVTVGRRPEYTLIRILVLVIPCLIIFGFVLLPIRVTGISMQPTYRNHSVNFINRLTYRYHEPQRGDIVGIRMAGDHELYLKRIVGLPGETVGFAGGHIVINDQTLSEPYEKSPCDWNVPSVQLGPDEYFVVGDNRTMPAEDHVFGKVLRERIIGRVLL
jgi:signal peptidase I